MRQLEACAGEYAGLLASLASLDSLTARDAKGAAEPSAPSLGVELREASASFGAELAKMGEAADALPLHAASYSDSTEPLRSVRLLSPSALSMALQSDSCRRNGLAAL